MIGNHVYPRGYHGFESRSLSNKKKRMKKITLIMIFVLWFVIGVVYVSASSKEEKVTDPDFNEFQIKEDTVLDLNDSISIGQIRQMDSLHAAGKL